jgi:hypothetical protein
MKKTLRERYDERKNEQLLAEAFSDYFKSGSDNIKKFNSTIQQLKSVAQKSGITSLQTAVANAEKQFESVVMAQQQGQKPDATKSQMLSKATTFVGALSQFFNTFKSITAQLPSMKNALTNANTPENNKPLQDILGADAEKFGQLIATQLQKSGGGILNTIKRFFTGGGTENPTQVMQQFGLGANVLANDMLALTPQQMNAFIQSTSAVQPFQLSQSAGQQQTPSGTKPAEQSISAQQSQATQPTQQTQQSQPTQQSTATTGASQRPDPATAGQRDVAIQRAVRNRNAFNTQQLSTLSNEEIATDLHALAKALGIKL